MESLSLLAALEKLPGRAGLGIEIVQPDLGTKPDLPEQGDLLALP